MLFRPLPERHFLFECINAGQANLVLPLVAVEQGDGVAVADANDAAHQ